MTRGAFLAAYRESRARLMARFMMRLSRLDSRFERNVVTIQRSACSPGSPLRVTNVGGGGECSVGLFTSNPVLDDDDQIAHRVSQLARPGYIQRKRAVCRVRTEYSVYEFDFFSSFFF